MAYFKAASKKTSRSKADFAPAWIYATKKIPATNASGKTKEKTEPGTRIASKLSLVRVKRLELPRTKTPDPKSGASASSAIPAYTIGKI